MEELTSITKETIDKYGPLVKGMNLEIDQNVQKLCETYNASSGSTRSVLYVQLIACILSVITVINTAYDWHKGRLRSLHEQIKNYERAEVDLNLKHKTRMGSLSTSYNNAILGLTDTKRDKQLKLDLTRKFFKDTLAEYRSFAIDDRDTLQDLKRLETQRENIDRNRIENFQTIKIFLLGNSFEVNNLSLLSGLTFWLLLLVARYTLIREKNNLRIAFKAITDRYPDNADPCLIKKYEEIKTQISCPEPDFSQMVNWVRRRHHYYFLSMNEIFNMPDLDLSANRSNKKPFGKFVMTYIFILPSFVYLIVVLNDAGTFSAGWQSSHYLTIVLYLYSFVGLNIVFYFSNECTRQKITINNLFDHFKTHDYTFDKSQRNDTSNGKIPKLDNWYKTCFAAVVSIVYFLKQLFLLAPKALKKLFGSKTGKLKKKSRANKT